MPLGKKIVAQGWTQGFCTCYTSTLIFCVPHVIPGAGDTARNQRGQCAYPQTYWTLVLFCFLFFSKTGFLYSSRAGPETCSIDHADIKLTAICLSLPPKCCDYPMLLNQMFPLTIKSFMLLSSWCLWVFIYWLVGWLVGWDRSLSAALAVLEQTL